MIKFIFCKLLRAHIWRVFEIPTGVPAIGIIFRRCERCERAEYFDPIYDKWVFSATLSNYKDGL